MRARDNGIPRDRAAVDVMTTIGMSNALATGDQLKLFDWVSANWGV